MRNVQLPPPILWAGRIAGYLVLLLAAAIFYETKFGSPTPTAHREYILAVSRKAVYVSGLELGSIIAMITVGFISALIYVLARLAAGAAPKGKSRTPPG